MLISGAVWTFKSGGARFTEFLERGKANCVTTNQQHWRIALSRSFFGHRTRKNRVKLKIFGQRHFHLQKGLSENQS